MESWLPFFVAVTALAVILQMAILAGMYFQVRQMNERMTRLATDLHARLSPILTRLDGIIEDSHSRITSIVADAAEMVHLAHGQTMKFDRVLSEAVDRLREQILRADQILTGALEEIERAGSQFKKNVWEPVQQATAFIQGVKSGIDFLRGRRRSPERARAHQDEELFI